MTTKFEFDDQKNLDLLASAVLIWLPEGVTPDLQKVDLGDLSAPPAENPEAWWLLHEAITYAHTVVRTHRKVPWIKVGMKILSPQESCTIFDRMGNLQTSFSSGAAAK